jgi:predicted metalloprotease with PDZ domain
MRSLLLLSVLLMLPALGSAQTAIRYEIGFENRAHHEAEIRVTFPDIGPGPLQLRMSRTSPGRYALHEFAKNVYAFSATGVGGRPVTVTRPNPHQWDVTGHGGEVSVTYVLYADRADGTYAAIDRTHAHLNMPATFMWARDLDERPLELTVRVPEASGWRVATQLAPTEDPHRFTAANLAYFLDSPTEVSDHWTDSWTVSGADGAQTIRVALHHAGSEADASRYAQDVRAIVEASEGIFGVMPPFDHGTYTFLADYLPWAAGDGMEHRNSTVLTNTASLTDNRLGILGTVAHEFVHAWSIERIRPASLEPFDFEEANTSGELWFGEGFTSYYDDLILWRAGLIPDEDFAARMGSIANTVTLAPGRRFFSPVEMSLQAPFVDAAVAIDPNNRSNVFLSYYTWGSGIALGLDLTLRTGFEGVTLDHLMREMWRTHGSPEIPYDVDDVQTALARVTGDDAFAADFFDRYVRGREVPDYPRLLAAAGIAFEPSRPGAAWIGPLPVGADAEGVRITATPWIGTPLYEAGLDRGDRILAFDGQAATTADDIERILGAHRPGETIAARVLSRGTELEVTLVLEEDPERSGVLASPDRRSADQAATLERWRAASGAVGPGSPG